MIAPFDYLYNSIAENAGDNNKSRIFSDQTRPTDPRRADKSTRNLKPERLII